MRRALHRKAVRWLKKNNRPTHLERHHAAERSEALVARSHNQWNRDDGLPGRVIGVIWM